ncbi:hypothetical protein F383_02404 [Gossypium arboreum]|uniref:Uncharacterized protein n=1 Tax=Gossypium arboreum TaxID=29729 RepID=A0A0B0PKR8_GOSAR|nr:hypothetical protein F383_02404 [Gossypium arboreum]
MDLHGNLISIPIAQLLSYTMPHNDADAMSQTWSYTGSHNNADAMSQIWSYTVPHIDLVQPWYLPSIHNMS